MNAHQEKAADLLASNTTGASYLDPQTESLQAAAIEAGLALAYEQRTANLIALFGEGFAGTGLPYGDMFIQIKERLGLL